MIRRRSFAEILALAGILGGAAVSCGYEAREKSRGEFRQRSTEERASPETAYNILIDPKAGAAPLVLEPDARTQVRFFIGRPSPISVARGLPPNPALESLSGGRPIDLTVSLYCDLAEEDTLQQRWLRYDPGRKESTVAEFTITPRVAAVRKRAGLGRLVFVVDSDGAEVDVLKLDAFVGAPAPDALPLYESPRKLGLEALRPEDVSMPDLVLSLAAPAAGGVIPVALRPIHGGLRQALREALRDEGDEIRIFSSGVSANDLAGLSVRAFSALSAIGQTSEGPLHRAYANVGIATELSPMATGVLRFSDDDTRTALRIMKDPGEELYWRLFLRGDPSLRTAMEAVDEFDRDGRLGRALKIRIVSQNVYAPWQILYRGSGDGVDAGRFWGFRYELGTLQLVDSAQVRLSTLEKMPAAGEILFGTWKGISRPDVEDEIRTRAEILRGDLERESGIPVSGVLGKEDFLSQLKSGRNRLKMVYLYGHGSSGSVLFVYRSADGNVIPLHAPTVAGPYFKFSEGDGDTLVPADLDAFSREADMSGDPCFFGRQPIVILNACETGTAGARTPDNNGFVGALTRAGARAVVVTEAPVWAAFAQQFGRDLAARLFEGAEIRQALRETRWKHLREAGNPLGLVYSLYGNPAARFATDR